MNQAPNSPATVSEPRLLLLISMVQFVNILDFMLVMPLGPDFARELHVPLSQIGWIGGAYTGAAAVSGLLSARFLDRFDRRSALAVSLLGVVIGTASGGLATGLRSLMAARLVAGAFGGPAAALSLSIIADVVPPARRGRALGIVMGAFSVATVLGLPAALELARLGGWRSAFFAVAGLGVVIASAALFLMPPLRLHMQAAALQPAAVKAVGVQASRGPVFYALCSTFTVMVAAFSIIPNIASYVLGNLHYPRSGLGVLYFAGGVTSFIAMQLMGKVVDRFGSAFSAGIGTLVFVAILASVFVMQVPMPVMVIYAAFMTGMAVRNVALGAISSRVPLPHERARFMSLQSAVQHAAAALGAIMSSELLHERPDHAGIDGMPQVASIAIGLALLLPYFVRRIELALAQRDAAQEHTREAVAVPPMAAGTELEEPLSRA